MYRRGLRVGSARFVGPTSWGAGVDPTEEDSGEDLAEEAILAPEFCDGSGEDEDGEGAGPMEAAESASSGGEEPDASRGPAVPGVAAAEVQRFALAARSWAEGLQSLGAALLAAARRTPGQVCGLGASDAAGWWRRWATKTVAASLCVSSEVPKPAS